MSANVAGDERPIKVSSGFFTSSNEGALSEEADCDCTVGDRGSIDCATESSCIPLATFRFRLIVSLESSVGLSLKPLLDFETPLPFRCARFLRCR